MRVAVCDNDRAFRERLLCALAPHTKISSEDLFDSGAALLAAMPEREYDAVYLDIEMPGMNGLEVAQQLQQLRPGVIIIFVSGYTSYVSGAFKINAFQYLVKGAATDEEIVAELRRAEKRYAEDHYLYTFYNHAEATKIRIQHIVYIESRNRHLYVHTSDGQSHEFRGRLDAEENKLRPFRFVRIHKSYLVNMAYIARIGKLSLTLEDEAQTELTISRTYQENLLLTYNTYITGCSV